MTELDKCKIAFADAVIRFEIAQNELNRAKHALVTELNKPPEIPVDTAANTEIKSEN